jgi:TRAP-type C4-dicarboxylate transport system permease small subunit
MLVSAGGFSYDSVVSEAASAPAKRPEPAAAKLLSRLDRGVAKGEELVLIAALVVLILAGAGQAIANHVFGSSAPFFRDYIRFPVFIIAMIGAAYASQRGQQIGIDVLSRVLPARPKAIAQVVIALFVAAMCAVLVVEGYDVAQGESLGYMALPIGAGLIAFHYLIQAIIIVSYLAAGTEPPAREGPAVH